ncbi:MAG: S8 family serine peptidase [Dehalococcoidia bacterium]|nr:S8 family serine peptidase [Dehalococcoidia bacterium]
MAIEEIQRQSRQSSPVEVKPEASLPVGTPEPIRPSALEPPEGASSHKGLMDAKFVTVASRPVRVSRDQPKSASELGDQPEKPPDWFQLGFGTQVYRPEPGLDERLLRAVDSIRDRSFTYAFVILNEYLSDEVEKELAGLGVKILAPHASAHKVRVPLDRQVLTSVAELPYVAWLGYSLPGQKLDTLLQGAAKEYARDLDAFPVLINFFDREASEKHSRLLLERGIVLGQYDRDLEAYPAVLPVKLFQWLAEQDYVLYVELETPSSPSHDESMAAMGVDYIRTGGPGTNFTGASTILGIMDTGFMMGTSAPTPHVDLNKNGCGKNFTSDAAGVWNDENGHGTHVLGTIIGTGTGDSRYRGVATGVGSSGDTRIRAAKIWGRTGRGLSLWARKAMNYMDDSSACDSGRPKVINISGGASGVGFIGTDSLSRKLDTKVWKYKQAYIVAAGNDGPGGQTIGAPAAAKNALAIGNVWKNPDQESATQDTGDIRFTSSRGPTGDGRMKPNVVATGCDILSTEAGTTNGYTDMCGTSMATPHVSGIAATVMDHYPAFRDRPYLLRAHLMATSILHDDDTTPSDNDSGGRNTYGLGRVSSYVSHWARSNSNGWNVYWTWRNITNSNWGYRDIEVPSGTDRLVVVMTWDEPAASSGASEAVDYDLDLWIDRGANCTPNSKGECGEWNSQSYDDNVEYIIINNPGAGTYRLKIINWDAPGSGVPAAIVATVIRGDPTPEMNLTATPASTTVAVGTTVDITTTVTNQSYVASGVFLWASSPPGVSLLGVSTTREDGISMDFTSDDLTLGNIIQGDSRSATWTFQVNTSGRKRLKFGAWSENGGYQEQEVTINP